MTQDIEPLDYVKRTNIEEHKQFHDKINEIVKNLAPTVDRADQLLQQVGEQSTQVANAVTTANTASTQAQAAAATALGLGDRVTAVENSAAQNHSDITVLDGEVTDINNDLTNVVRKVTSDVQKVNKGLRVGEVPAGDDVVISRAIIDGYESMMRTTGNQVVDGTKQYNDLQIIGQIAGNTRDNMNGNVIYYWRSSVSQGTNVIIIQMEMYDRNGQAFVKTRIGSDEVVTSIGNRVDEPYTSLVVGKDTSGLIYIGATASANTIVSISPKIAYFGGTGRNLEPVHMVNPEGIREIYRGAWVQ